MTAFRNLLSATDLALPLFSIKSLKVIGDNTMKKQLFNFVMSLVFVLSLFGTNIQSAKASVLTAIPAALPNPGAMIPVPSGAYARYTKEPHLSGFTMGYITNKGQLTSSIDLGYSGTVVAPITGKVMIAKSCTNGQQIVFINGDRGTDGYGWSIGLVHIHVNSARGIKDGVRVTKGQVIGYTVLPPRTNDGQGCGFGTGMHIHYTLMKWKMATNGPVFTEQNIVNTYIGSWIVKNTYLDGSKYDIQLGQLIK